MNYDPNIIRKKMMQGFVYNTPSFEDMVMVKGKAAVVSGGTSGLGFCIAHRLLQGGANVVLSSFSEAEAEIALPLLKEAGFGEDRVRFFQSDVTKEEDMEALVKFTAEAFGTLDIAVNSAGIWSYAHIYDLPEDEFLRVINVNLNGTFRFAKYVSRYMVEKEIKGKILFISSDVYIMPFPVFGGYPHYAASKGGIVAMTTEIARELKRYGIMVNTVAPGPMATPGGMVNGVVRSLSDEKKAAFAEEMKVAQVDQAPDTDAVARAAYMMCTKMADGITGDCILANSGLAHGCVVRQPAIAEFPPRAE